MSIQKSRREFLKYVGAGAASLSVGRYTGSAISAEKERCVYLSEADIVEIREKIEKYPWAAKLYERLKAEVQPGAERKKNIWAASRLIQDKALVYRISGDESFMPGIVEMLVQRFSLDKMDKPLGPGRWP